ncbi:MAG TPA: hypothetical protein VGJ32_04000 [Solirubrobacteraceae bacterium]|jgi:hypothetical protein
MNQVERWFHRQAGREARIVTLDEAMLGGRLWRYAFYRLRYFFLTYLVESASHAVLVLLLFRGLGWDNFLLVVVAAASTSLISHFWWGALEAMRAQVRDLHRSGQPHRIPAAIAGWLTFAAVPAALAGVAAIAWTAGLAIAGRLGPAEAFAATLLLRVAVDLPTRCYHSGIYAMRRVYRPLSATIAPELLGLATMLALYPAAGVWALVVSSLLVTATTTALTVHYTHRVYHFLGFDALPHLGVRALRRSLRGAGREWLAGGASHAVMGLDSLAVLALLHGARTDSRAVVVLFLSMPTIRAAADWARLLYFDLKRLELRLFTNLRRRFERQTWVLAWLLGLVFWALADAISIAFYGHALGGLSAALLAFFLARSVLAREQIQAFAARSYAAVIGTGVACLAGLAAVGTLADGDAQRLAAVALVTGVCAAALNRLIRADRAHGEPGTALLTLEWLRRLGHVREPVRVGSARIASATGPERLDARSREEGNRWRLGQLAERIARRLGQAGAAAWVGPDRVVWFEPSGSSGRVTAEWLQRVSGGLVAEMRLRDCPDGEEALLAAGQGDLLGRASPHLLTAIVPVDVAAVRRTFDEVLPGGTVYAPEEPVPEALAALPALERRAIFYDAVRFARDLGVGRRRSCFDVTALCAGGELRLIFIADRQVSRRARARWHARVTALNVRAAIGGERARPAAPRLVRPVALRAR